MDSVQIKLSKDQVPYKDFLLAIERMHRLLTSEASGKVKWEVSVQKGSNIVNFYPTEETDAGKRAIELIRAIEKDGSIITNPKMDSVEAIKDLASLYVDGDGELTISSGSQKTVMTADTLASATHILKTEYSEQSSVSGRVFLLRAATGHQATVKSEIHDTSIKCFFRHDDTAIRHDLIVAFDQGRRVVVSGLLHWRHGKPYKIEVASVRIINNDGFDPLSVAGILNG